MSTRRSVLQTAGAALAVTVSGRAAGQQGKTMTPFRPIPRSARDRLEEALSRIADPGGEGTRAFLTILPELSEEAVNA